MKNNSKKILITIAIVWLILSLAWLIYCQIYRCSFSCISENSGVKICACHLKGFDIVSLVIGELILGIPSWIIFFLVFRGKIKK